MALLREAFQNSPGFALTLAGLLAGALFGALANATNFCVMGAVSDWRTFSDKGRIGAVALAAATAIAGAQFLDAHGVTELSRSIYLAPQFNWAGALLGGLAFGFGMVLAGGCASRNLIRAGGGDVRALLALLVMVLAAFAAISGVLGHPRASFEMATAADPARIGMAHPSLPAALQRAGMSDFSARVAASSAIALPLLVFAIAAGRVHRSPRNLLGGLGAGLIVSLGWLATGLAFDEMAVRPITPQSLSFVRPVADAVDWIERSTALGLPGFGASVVFGTLVGSALVAVGSGQFAVSAFAGKDDLVRHLTGAALMGIGGVFALGCSIGQGITGVSTLSLQSLIAALSIIAGTWAGLSWLERRV